MTPHIRANLDRPIYRQIMDQLSRAIDADEIRSGEALTPLTELAEQLAISPLTVRKAYRGLEERGFCTRSADDTYRVAAVPPAVKRKRLRRSRLETLESELLLQQLEMAREAQRRLLPPVSIEDPSFAVAARSQPAGFVSGDFYDVVRFGDGTVGVVVGDVAGKGLSASLVMASVKAMMPFVAASQSVGGTLRELNRRLHGELGRRGFVALAYARLDPGRGRLEIANAGLPDPCLFPPGAAPEVVGVAPPRLPLGIRREVDYRASVLPMPAGARLLLYSDGIPEAIGRDGEPLGYDAFLRIAGERAPAAATAERESLDGWLEGLLAAVSRRAAVGRDDDWTAVVLEARGPARPGPIGSSSGSPGG